MNRQNGLKLGLGLVFLAVFNAVFFIAGGTDHPKSVWLAYAFIHIAYLLLVATSFLVKENSQKVVMGMPLYTVSTIYFALSFVINLIFVFAKPETLTACLIINIILTGFYVASMLTLVMANDATQAAVDRREKELMYVNEASGRLKAMQESAGDEALARKIERVYDLVRNSQVKSSQGVHNQERNVLRMLDELEYLVESKDPAAEETLREVEKAARERNRMLQYGK